MSKEWYYNQDDAPCGPVDEPEIIRLIQSGELPPGVLVCFEGGSEWLPAHQYTCFKVEVHPKEKTPEPATSLPAPKPVSTGTLQSPGQISISPEARQALEQGDIAAAVQTTAAENPNLRRLEICALLGEAVLDNRPAAIPIAEPLRWDQDLMRLNGIQGVHVDISLAGWKENYKQEHKNVAKALDKPFPDSDARR